MDLFIDRSRWPELIRTGYERTSAAFARFSRAAEPSDRPLDPRLASPQQSLILRTWRFAVTH
jgi:hypothetical protein